MKHDDFVTLLLGNAPFNDAAIVESTVTYTVKNAVELFFAFHPDVEKIQYH